MGQSLESSLMGRIFSRIKTHTSWAENAKINQDDRDNLPSVIYTTKWTYEIAIFDIVLLLFIKIKFPFCWIRIRFL